MSLTILKTAIRQVNNLFCLNDLHQVSGSEKKHQPNNFIRLDTTKDLILEIESENPNNSAIQTVNGGTNRGTYACEEIALAYAMWISPKFHLTVLRAFIAMHENKNLQSQQQNLPLVIPNPAYQELLHLVMKLKTYAGLYSDFQRAITSKANDPAAQHKEICATFSNLKNNESFLFVFKPNIERDLEQANDIIRKHVFNDF